MREMVNVLPSEEEEQEDNGNCEQDAETEHVLQSCMNHKRWTAVREVGLHT